MMSYHPLVSAEVGKSLYRVQCVCLVGFLITVVAVPLMLASRPNLPYYVLSRSNFTAAPTVEYHSDMKASTLLLMFLLPSVLEHLFAVVASHKYAMFTIGIGWHRWISYIVSAPSLVALVIYSIGPGSEIAVTILTVGLVVVCIGMGPIVEYATVINDKKLFVMGMLVGFTALFFAFVPVWYYYDRADIPPDIEPYIAAMVAVITALYWSFGFVPLYVFYCNKSTDRETIYCILSLAAKLPLAWLYAAMLATRD